jgi:hypothetical protein
MKKNSPLILLALVPLLVIMSCTTPSNENGEQEVVEKIEGTPYSNDAVGWSVTVPDGWEVMSKNQLDENMKNGQDLIAESSTINLDYEGLTHLINFQKDPYNQFLSSMEPFDLDYEGEWEENNKLVYDFLYETFQYQGVPCDTSSRTTQIDGLLFHVFSITLYTPDGLVLMYEDMYGRYINGYDFSIIITYNNTDDKVLLERVIRQSKFTLRD